tara:strand:+ start:265 stop:1017 length:753 start_codon:yes stop_codon:yes gene_type:complete
MSDNTDQFDENDYLLNNNSKIGILLIHGFSSTNYELRDLAHFLADAGFRVMAKNLPGHGTTIQDCNNHKYTEWLSFTKSNIGELVAECDKVFCIGISMGAVIALYIAATMPIAGVIAAASVFKFRNEFMTKYINTIFCPIIHSIDKKSQFPKGARKGKYYGYTRYPTIALNQMRILINFVEPKLEKISIPTLLINSTSDNTCQMKNLDFLKKKIDIKYVKTLIINKASHAIFDKSDDRDTIFNQCVKFIR